MHNKRIQQTLFASQSGGVFLPHSLSNLAAWFRYGQGITVTGSGVSQWDDLSGNGRHLKQATDANRPAKQTDGSILFNGTSHYLKADAFTLNQPCTFYLLFKQVTWTDVDYIWDGNVLNTARLYQATSSPKIWITAGVADVEVPSATLDTYGIVTAIYNGASSVTQWNNNTAGSGNAGTGNPGGLILGSRPDGAAWWSNIEVKEMIIYSAAHDAATRSKIIRYLATVGNVAI